MTDDNRTNVPQELTGQEREIYYKSNHDAARTLCHTLATMPVAYWTAYQAGLIDWRGQRDLKHTARIICIFIKENSESKLIQRLRCQGYLQGARGTDIGQAQDHYTCCCDHLLKKYGPL